jgi:hypothetical protein
MVAFCDDVLASGAGNLLAEWVSGKRSLVFFSLSFFQVIYIR